MAADTQPLPRSSRSAATQWAHVVRGEPELPATTAASAHDTQDRAAQFTAGSEGASPDISRPPENADSNAVTANGRKLAWNRPSTDCAVTEAGPVVMGAVSWPALSESTRASSRTSSSDSLKALVPDGSSTPFAPSGSATSSTSSKSSNANTDSSSSHAPNRQKLLKQPPGGCDDAITIGTHGSSSPVESPTSIPPEPSPKNGGYGDPIPGGGNNHPRGYYKRGKNNGGGSPHHGNYQNRREHHDRGGYEWNQSRGYSNRGLRMHHLPPPPAVYRPYMGPPPPPPAGMPFVAPLPVRPFVNTMVYPEIVPPMFYYPAPMMHDPSRGMPLVPPPVTPVVFVPQPDNRAMLLKQIDYYFSPENLCKDIYLRQNMDKEGWVSVDLIANFNRVKQLTNNKEYILDVIQVSDVVEVKEEKIRKRNDWISWVLPPQSTSSVNYDSLAAKLENTRLEGGMTNHSRTLSPNKPEAVLS